MTWAKQLKDLRVQKEALDHLANMDVEKAPPAVPALVELYNDDKRPEHLESLGLLSALEQCARRMISQNSSVEVTTASEGEIQNIPLRVSDTLLRIGYEAIANAIRHSRCSRLGISLVYRRSAVEMIIKDDGTGFVVSSDSAGFGIRGMHKRADNISASFAISSAPGEGTSVHVVAPLPPSFLRALSHRWMIQLQMRKDHDERTRV